MWLGVRKVRRRESNHSVTQHNKEPRSGYGVLTVPSVADATGRRESNDEDDSSRRPARRSSRRRVQLLAPTETWTNVHRDELNRRTEPES